MVKVEAVVVRDRVEAVMDAVEAATGHVGVTVLEAVGHGRQPGITHEYRGRVFESRFLPKALLVFVVEDELAEAIVETVVETARTGHESGDGIVWTTPVSGVRHNRTALPLEAVEALATATSRSPRPRSGSSSPRSSSCSCRPASPSSRPG